MDLLKITNNDVSDIVRRSSKATCAIMEREVVVKNTEVSKTKTRLKNAGFVIIGTGPGGLGRTKIWFIRRGGF